MDKLLTPAQLAGLLGLATQTIYNRHCMGAPLPPCVRIGRVIRFPLTGVETWIAGHAEKPLPARADVSPRRPGRPSKAEQIAQRKGGAK